MSDLQESVENIVREAMDQAIASRTRCPVNEPDSRVVTREIIEAVADAMERQSAPFYFASQLTWLRSQASTPDTVDSGEPK